MPNQIAGILSLIAFVTCLLIGAFEAGNSFTVTVYRGLLAMLGTYVVGYLVGIAAERMLADNVAAEEKRIAEARKKAAEAEAAATDGR